MPSLIWSDRTKKILLLFGVLWKASYETTGPTPKLIVLTETIFVKQNLTDGVGGGEDTGQDVAGFVVVAGGGRFVMVVTGGAGVVVGGCCVVQELMLWPIR